MIGWPAWDEIHDVPCGDERELCLAHAAAAIIGRGRVVRTRGHAGRLVRTALERSWVDFTTTEVWAALDRALDEGWIIERPDGSLEGRPDDPGPACVPALEDLEAPAAGVPPWRLTTPAATFRKSPLSAEEERALAQRIEAGDGLALRALVEASTRLAASHAKERWRGRSPALDIDDLFQEATLGLLRAAEKFDHRRMTKFSTYATWWIRQAVSRARADKAATIRLPVYVVEKQNRVRRASAAAQRSLGREPDADEIAWIGEVALSEVHEVLALLPPPLSLDALAEGCADQIEDLGELLLEQAPDPSVEVLDAVDLQRLRQLLNALPDRQRQIVELRYGLWGERPHTLEEIGDLFSVTRERVRQVHNQALERLATLAAASGDHAAGANSPPARGRASPPLAEPVDPAAEVSAALASLGQEPGMTGVERRALARRAARAMSLARASAAEILRILEGVDAKGHRDFAGSLLEILPTQGGVLLPALGWLRIARWGVALGFADASLRILTTHVEVADLDEAGMSQYEIAVLDAGCLAALPIAAIGALRRDGITPSDEPGPSRLYWARAAVHCALATGDGADLADVRARVAPLDGFESDLLLTMLRSDAAFQRARGHVGYAGELEAFRGIESLSSASEVARPPSGGEPAGTTDMSTEASREELLTIWVRLTGHPITDAQRATFHAHPDAAAIASLMQAVRAERVEEVGRVVLRAKGELRLREWRGAVEAG
jgi:RNA polymerase sigma factor (sigma-70 family)